MKDTISNYQKKTNNNLIIFIWAVFFGGLYSIYLIGKLINPFNIDWLFNRGDPASHFIGWLYFSQDSWFWPLTFSKNLAYPTGAIISYSDSIPLWAIIFKLLSHFFSNNIQYFGCFIVFNFIMQFFWGAKLSFLFKKKSIYSAILSGLLFMLAPPLTWRLHGHFALTSHWLILSGIWCYYQLKSTPNIKRIITIQLIFLLIASGIHPYLATMVLGLAIAGQLQLFILRNFSLFKTTFILILSISILILGWYFWGYLPSPGSQSNSYSYGHFALNVLSIINPQDSSLFMNTLPLRTGDYEGFNYLGLGIILLIFANLFKLISQKNQQIIRIKSFPQLISSWFFKDLALYLLLICLIIFSLSNKISWGNSIILEYPLPTIVRNLFENFRASGRFFWTVHYAIILGLIVSTFRIWKHQQTKVLLTIIVLIQFLDLLPLHAGSTLWMKSQSSNSLKSEVWKHLHEEYNQLIILPSHQCGNSPAPFPIFEKLAVLQGLKTNSAYLARYRSEDLQIHCEELLNLFSSKHLDKDTAYILGRQFFDEVKEINKEQNNSHYCNLVDSYFICHKRNTSLFSKNELKFSVPSYSLYRILNFETKANNSWEYQFGGWSNPGENGTWIDGTEAHLIMQIKQPIQDNLILKATVTPFLNEKHPEQVVDILANGHPTKQWMFQFNSEDELKTTREAIIPAKLIKTDDLLNITFRLQKPVSPSELKLSEDRRLLSLEFKNFQLSPVNPASRVNKVLNFKSQNNSSLEYQLGDWSEPEPIGTWTDGTDAKLRIPIKQPIKDNLILEANVSPFLNQKHPKQLVDILVNGQFLTQWVFQIDFVENKQENIRKITIPAEFIQDNNDNHLELNFRIQKPVSPHSLGLSQDKRLLGLNVKTIQLYKE